MESERERKLERTRRAGADGGGDEAPESGAAQGLLAEARAWGSVAQGTLEECGGEREIDLELQLRRQRGGE